MAIMLTYDIRRTTATIHTELKNYLIDTLGYSGRILSNEPQWYLLPNTTVLKANITPQQAETEFLAACRAVGAHWERYVASDYETAAFDNQD